MCKRNIFLFLEEDTISHLCGQLVTLFWTSCPGFQSLGRLPGLHILSLVHNVFLSVTSGATPADLLGTCMEAEPYRSTLILIAKCFQNIHPFKRLFSWVLCRNQDFLPYNLSASKLNVNYCDKQILEDWEYVTSHRLHELNCKWLLQKTHWLHSALISHPLNWVTTQLIQAQYIILAYKTQGQR